MTVEDIVSEAQAGCVKTNHVGGVNINGCVSIGRGSTAHGDSALAAGVSSEAWSASVAEGTASYANNYSHAEGDHTYANLYSHAEGFRSRGMAKYSHVAGLRAMANHFGSYVWQGLTSESISTEYLSHGVGTYNISPVGGTDGFWIGETNFTQHVRNIADEGERRVAVFVIPLNAPDDGGWNCLELKATTNNFDATVGGESRLVYYAHTSVPDGGEYGGTSLDGVGVFLVGTGEDDRSYVATEGDALDGARSVVLVVDVSKCRRTDGAWLSSECDDLAWVCLRGSNDGREMDGGRTAWRPCAPVRWCRTLPNWAR